MGSRVDNAGSPQLHSGMRELYWGIEEGSVSGISHHTATRNATLTKPAEHVSPATVALLDTKRGNSDYAGWAAVIGTSAAYPWWQRTILAMMAAGTITVPGDAAERWCKARDRHQ